MFCPVDQAQEHNIKDIKVTYRSEGPNVKWEFLKKLHPAIHVIRAVAAHVENEFGTYTRGNKHTVPKKDQDVTRLRESYSSSGYLHFENGRVISQKEDKAKDYLLIGALKINTGKVLHRWNHLRSFERATTEDWEEMVL